jgi:cysteine desulfurase
MYLDNAATTPIDPRVLDAMLPIMTEQFGNPHSTTHMYGWENSAQVEYAREQVAELIGADPKEIIFTSGATESNNIAIKGVARFYQKAGKTHIITSVIEHKCVLDSCRKLESEGFTVTYVGVDKHGLIDMEALENTLKEKQGQVALVSIMHVNNEIGVRQDLKEIGALCHKYKTWFHTDAAQSVGKVPINVNEMNVDLLSISGHKIYGPKGIGALFIRRKPRVKAEAIQSGGGQERGLRSGTLPSSLVIGIGKACEIAIKEMENDRAHAQMLYDRFYQKISTELDFVYLNGHPENRWVGNINLSFAYVEGESLLLGLKNVACSSGSACTSASLEPSYVLRAVGVGDDLAHTSIRFGFGRFTTIAEVDYAADEVIKSVRRLREMSPLYDLALEGVDINTIQWNQEHSS